MIDPARVLAWLDAEIADGQAEMAKQNSFADESFYSGEIMALKRARVHVAALAQAPAAPPTAHQHRFEHYMVCSVCGLTEAAASSDCHHCDEAAIGQRCWWCLRVREAAAPRPASAAHRLLSARSLAA